MDMQIPARSDKWYLGGGDRLLWAPPFPVWLEYPGLWDEVHYFNHSIFPCFTWTLLDGNGRPYVLRRGRVQWSPAGMSAALHISDRPFHGASRQKAEGGFFTGEVAAWENLVMTADDRLCAEITIDGDEDAWGGGLHLVVWTAQPDTGGLYVLADGRETKSGDFAAGSWGIVWTRTLMPPGHPHIDVRCRLSLDREASSWSVQFSEGKTIQPHWGLTPWSGGWERPGLSSEVHQSGNAPHGQYFAALHSVLVPGTDGRDRLVAIFDIPGETGMEAVSTEQVSIGVETVRNPPVWNIESDLWDEGSALEARSFGCQGNAAQLYCLPARGWLLSGPHLLQYRLIEKADPSVQVN